MPAAGVAYDGSLWVTAASSVALGALKYLQPVFFIFIDMVAIDEMCSTEDMTAYMV